MNKRLAKKLELTRETLHQLAAAKLKPVAAGYPGPDIQCPPTEDSSGFSGAPISYCNTYSGVSECA